METDPSKHQLQTDVMKTQSFHGLVVQLLKIVEITDVTVTSTVVVTATLTVVVTAISTVVVTVISTVVATVIEKLTMEEHGEELSQSKRQTGKQK